MRKLIVAEHISLDWFFWWPRRQTSARATSDEYDIADRLGNTI
jgi:hypothetical protein